MSSIYALSNIYVKYKSYHPDCCNHYRNSIFRAQTEKKANPIPILFLICAKSSVFHTIY